MTGSNRFDSYTNGTTPIVRRFAEGLRAIKKFSNSYFISAAGENFENFGRTISLCEARFALFQRRFRACESNL